MSTLPALVRSYTTLDAAEVATSHLPVQVAQGLVTKEWRLLDIVKELGEVLVSETDSLRARGVRLLSAVVGAIAKASLDRQSTKTLVTFFTDKLADGASVVACATALTELTQCPNFGVGEGMEVMRGILKSVKLPSYPQSTRFTVYTLLDSLMSRSRPALKRLGKDFVKGYCALAEGEKDPRNLMLSFSIVRVILVEFEVTDSIEDLFDITFCYFPITFTPPPDDPYGITSEDLVVALRDCLSANARFGPLALPLFLDKMQAASEKAKRQTLEALTTCFPIYGAAVCGEWAGRFSEALSIEIFHATDNDTMELALTSLQSLFATLYPDVAPVTVPQLQTVDEDEEMLADAPTLSSTVIHGIGVKVVANSLEELKEPDKVNAKPAAKILAALLASSNRLAHYVLSLSLPQLLAVFKDPDEVALRAPVLTCISTLLAALAPPPPISTTSSTPPPPFTRPILSHSDGESPLEPFRDDLLSILTSGSRSATSRSAAMEGLVNLIQISEFLSPHEVTYCVSAINDVLLSPEEEAQYEAALDALVVISKLHPKIIEEATLPILFTALPSDAPVGSSPQNAIYRKALSSLAALCVHPDLFEILTLRLLARLEGVCSIVSTDEASHSRSGLYAHHLLVTLQAVLRAKVTAGHADIPKYIEKFVPRLYGLFILPTLEAMDQGEVAKDPRLLIDAGKVITLVVQRVDVARQSAFSVALNSAFADGDLATLLGEQAKNAVERPFQPLSAASEESQQDTVVLYSAAVLAMRPTITTSTEDVSSFLRSDLLRCLTSQNETQRTVALHLLGSTVNKRAPDIADFLSTHLAEFWEQNIVAPLQPVARRKAALRAWSWVVKGLIIRSDQRGYEKTAQILDLFHDPVLGRDAAVALGVIASEEDRVLSKENFAVIRLLFKQRFFTFLLPKLVSGHKESSGPDQPIYLVALSCLLQHIPKQMSLTELPKLLPLLITSLELPDPALRANVIETLSILAKEVPKEMENSISDIVTKVLQGIVGDVSNSQGSVKLRIASLTFLGVLPLHIPYIALQSQKPTVLKQLGKAVDDPKRDVRKAAVDCRSRWYLYTA